MNYGKMKQIVFLALIIMGSAFIETSSAQMPAPSRGSSLVPLEQPVPATNVTFSGKDGIQSLDQYKGKVILLHYWAIFCPPCVEELPSVDKLQAAFDPGSFKVIAISTGREDVNGIRSYLDKNQLAHLDALVGSSYLPRAIPVSFLIDKNGNVVATVEGPTNWSSSRNLDMIKKYMGQ